jgi:nucleotide-binding universal stress UspA family protein
VRTNIAHTRMTTLRRKKLRLLVAIDFSPESRKALRVARGLVFQSGGSLTLAHVRPSSDVRAAVVEDRGDLLKGPTGTLRETIARHYRKRLGSFSRGDDVEMLKLLRGKPSLELQREARRGYDFLVMGSRGRGRVSAALLGSTVQETLARSPVPVLVVGH